MGVYLYTCTEYTEYTYIEVIIFINPYPPYTLYRLV